MKSFPALPRSSLLERVVLNMPIGRPQWLGSENTKDSDVIQSALDRLNQALKTLRPSGRVLKAKYRSPSDLFQLKASIPRQGPGRQNAIAMIAAAGFQLGNLPDPEHSHNRVLVVTGDLKPVHDFLGTPVAEIELAHS